MNSAADVRELPRVITARPKKVGLSVVAKWVNYFVTMKSPPKGWPRLTVGLFYEDAKGAIEWLCRAFGFETQLVVEGEGDRIEHSQLVFGEAMVMVGSAGREGRDVFCSPKAVGGKNTHGLCICVDDVDAHCEHARRAGATISIEPTTVDYGEDYWADRTYQAIDPEGVAWWFLQRIRG